MIVFQLRTISLRVALSLLLIALFGFALKTPASAADWIELKSENFVVYSTADIDTSRKLIEDLEHFRFYLQFVTSIKSTSAPLPLTIFAFKDGRSFQKYVSSPGVYGFFTHQMKGAAAYARIDKAKKVYNLDGRVVLFHEYVHYFVSQFSPYEYPRWFSEGFAEYLATFKIDSGMVTVGKLSMHRLAALRDDTWAPLRLLFGDDYRYLGRSKRSSFNVGTFYAQSWLAVHYLQSEPELRAQLADYIVALNKGTPYLEAYSQSFKFSKEVFYDNLKHYWKVGKLPNSQYDLSQFAFTPQISVRELSGQEDKLVLAYANSFRSSGDSIRRKLGKSLKKTLKKNPDNFDALKLLVEHELWGGSLEKAEAQIGRLVGLAPKDPNVLALQGAVIIRRASVTMDKAEQTKLIQEGRSILRQATSQQPQNIYGQYYLGYSHLRFGGSGLAEGMAAMTKARELVPQNGWVKLNYARLAARTGNITEAIPMLESIIYQDRWEDIVGIAKAELAKLQEEER